MSELQSILRILTIASAALVIQACLPTDPRNPITTLPPCCRVDIYETGTGRALFNPVLNMCPMTANFICSVRDELVKDPTTVVINGNDVVATGPNGVNSFLSITCRESDKQWVTAKDVIVNTITCKNDMA